MKYFFFIVFSLFGVTLVYADTIVLSCTPEGRNPHHPVLDFTIDLTFDVEARTLKLGTFEDLEIVQITNSHISAYANNKNVGGHMFVLNRKTGEYSRAMIFQASKEPEDTAELTLVSNNGVCKP